MIRPLALYGGLALAYAILAVIFTRPLAFHLGDFTPRGSGSGDQCQSIWFFWWTKTALFGLHQSPFWTDAIYFPHGTGVGYHLSLFTNLLAIALSEVIRVPINSPLIYNLLVFASFVVIGLGTFVLLRHLTRDSLASFLGSLFVVLAPYRLFHLDHFNLLSFGWGVFAIYFAIRFLEKPRVPPLAGAVSFFVMQFYMSLTNAMLTALFLVFYAALFAGTFWRSPDRRRLIIGAVIGAAVTVLLVLPCLLNLNSTGAEWSLGWQDSVPFAADLLDFVMHSGRAAGSGPSEAYVGWLLIGLVVLTLLYAKRRYSLAWPLLAITFMILSMGPSLQVGGVRILEGWMPYRWLLETVPYFNLSRTPARFIVLAELCLAVVAAFGLSALLGRLRRSSRRFMSWWLPVAGSAILALAIFADYDSVAIALEPMYVPPVYQQVAADSTIHVICDLPIAEKLQICNWYMYWQTIHGRKAANGYLTHHSKSATTLLDRIKSWDELGPTEKAELAAAGIDAVVLHHPDRESELIRLR